MIRRMNIKTMAIRLVLITLPAIPASPARADASRRDRSPVAAHDTWATTLRLARSPDGVKFTDTGAVFLRHASAPDLVRMPDGGLLALFDYAKDKNGDDETVMAVARSKDGGHSWSPLQPIKFRGGGARNVRGVHGDLLRMTGEEVRLYFAKTLSGARPESKARTVIRSAVTRDGVEFRLDRATRVALPGGDDVHPMIVRIGGTVHLYVAGLGVGSRSRRSTTPETLHGTSRDGRRFAPLSAMRTAAAWFVGSGVEIDGGVRAYVTGKRGVVSFVAGDGVDWKREEGVRIADGWDPAVARLEDGSYLMLYCTASTGASHARSQLVRVAESAHDRVASAAGHGSTKTTGAEPGESADAKASTADQERDPALINAALDDGFWAPRPDFKTKVDYLKWYRGLLDPTQDNAYHAYARIMPDPHDETENAAFRDLFHDMFNDRNLQGPPGPWDPAGHPDWEASSQMVGGILAQFREATMHEGYASPVRISDEQLEEIPGHEPLLMGLLLPQLSHHRTLCRATMAGAWRQEDGKVSAGRMLDAWETVLRNASHLDRGATLIEDLVATAERRLVQENARWALMEGVFSEEELATALDVLRDYDRDDRGPADTIRGEHAFMMDATQYMFSPPDAEGRPRINIERAEYLMQWADGFDLDAWRPRIAALGPEDACATLAAADACYAGLAEQMEIGYPQVRGRDIDAITQTYRHVSPLAEVFLPSLSRVHQLTARSQTSRRATRAAYATHLFRSRTGRWPASLAELAPEFGERMLTDPFSGDYFGYRLTDDGPTIYSVSENGLDDGGIHARRWGDDLAGEGGSDDYVFWPPQPRR